jgi:hypothetical protein
LETVENLCCVHDRKAAPDIYFGTLEFEALISSGACRPAVGAVVEGLDVALPSQQAFFVPGTTHVNDGAREGKKGTPKGHS